MDCFFAEVKVKETQRVRVRRVIADRLDHGEAITELKELFAEPA